jgi:hypothetical protein
LSCQVQEEVEELRVEALVGDSVPREEVCQEEATDQGQEAL